MTKPEDTKDTKAGAGSLRALSLLISALRRDVDNLKKAVARPGARTLDDLLDTEVLYDHWTDLPKHGQALRWDTTRDSKYHGLATFSDPTVVSDYFTEPVTGAGTFLVDEFLVDSDWDINRPCLVTATVFFNGSYTPQESQAPVGDVPQLLHAGPYMSASVVDRGTGYVTTPGAAFEATAEVWPVMVLTGNSPAPTTVSSAARTLTWLFLRGRPKVQVTCIVSSAAAPGLSGSPQVVVISRVTRL